MAQSLQTHCTFTRGTTAYSYLAWRNAPDCVAAYRSRRNVCSSLWMPQGPGLPRSWNCSATCKGHSLRPAATTRRLRQDSSLAAQLQILIPSAGRIWANSARIAAGSHPSRIAETRHGHTTQACVWYTLSDLNFFRVISGDGYSPRIDGDLQSPAAPPVRL